MPVLYTPTPVIPYRLIRLPYAQPLCDVDFHWGVFITPILVVNHPFDFVILIEYSL